MTLHCIDAKGIAFDVAPNEVTFGFREKGSYLFICQATGARLFIDDAAVEEVAFENGLAWRWQPGFFAGEVSAELVDELGKCIGEYRLDVSPAEKKLGRETFGDMINELFAFDPRLLIGTEEAQSGIGVSGDISNPHLEYARLRRYGRAFVKALKAVSEKPLTRLRQERKLVPVNQVRRLDLGSALRALRDPASFPFIRPSLGVVPNAAEARFDIASSYDDLDNPANQTLSATLNSVMRRTKQVERSFHAQAAMETESGARSALPPRLTRRCDFLNDLFLSLHRIRRARPYAVVSRSEVSAAGLNVVSAHPAYSRAFRLGWLALRSGIAGQKNEETLWISPTWEVYERWTFLQVYKALQQVFPQAQWKRSYPTSRTDCVHLTSNVSTAQVSVYLQVWCPAWDVSPTNDFHSISGERYPDVVVTLDSKDKKRFVVFDAKYRTSRAGVLDGMQSAHLYKDCLRWKGNRPDSVLLLVPKSGGAEWLESEEFRRDHGVGVVALGGNGDLFRLSCVLTELLRDETKV